jgi:hypothetical protein
MCGCGVEIVNIEISAHVLGITHVVSAAQNSKISSSAKSASLRSSFVSINNAEVVSKIGSAVSDLMANELSSFSAIVKRRREARERRRAWWRWQRNRPTRNAGAAVALWEAIINIEHKSKLVR